MDESREQVKGAERDKINSNPALGCPEPQITSHRYIHRGSSLFDADHPLHGYTRYLSSLYLSDVHHDSDVAEIRFQKTHIQSIVLLLRSVILIINKIFRIMIYSQRKRLFNRLL